ncbi:uncharacterized protein [Amphiura filiformis]|uniref:uncharacterized protein n=1 Tax=Amphiura filiformis TaxID=82378 RepID=UPI003B2130A6
MADLESVLSARDREYEKRYNNHDTKGVVDMYTEDCRWMQPDKDTQIGRKAVEEFLKYVMKAGANSLILEMDENGPLGDNLVYQRSRYTFLKTDGSLFGKGKLVVIWKKVDGVYHLYTKIFNPCPA